MARILVVDDEPGVREIMHAACELDGHEVRSAADLDTAVRAYVDDDPELMILDLIMPGGGGEEILQRLDELGGTRACRIIFVSGLAGDVSEDLRDDPRVREILQKPFGIDTLRQAVREALA